MPKKDFFTGFKDMTKEREELGIIRKRAGRPRKVITATTQKHKRCAGDFSVKVEKRTELDLTKLPRRFVGVRNESGENGKLTQSTTVNAGITDGKGNVFIERKIVEDAKFLDWSPNPEMMRFLASWLNAEDPKDLQPYSLAKSIGIEKDTLDGWMRSIVFQRWFYEQVQAHKYRYGVKIVSRLITRASQVGAPRDIIELALRVLDIYTPTNKTIEEKTFNINYREQIERVKQKAIEMGVEAVEEAQTMEESNATDAKNEAENAKTSG